MTSDVLKRREQPLQALCTRRDQMEAYIAQDGAKHPYAAVKLKRGFVYTERGMRHFVYPPMPDALDLNTQREIYRKWIEKELVGRGMVCDFTWFESGPIFSCTTRELKQDGFGDIVQEWKTLEFFAKIKASFINAVNDALENQSLPRNFDF